MPIRVFEPENDLFYYSYSILYIQVETHRQQRPLHIIIDLLFAISSQMLSGQCCCCMYLHNCSKWGGLLKLEL